MNIDDLQKYMWTMSGMRPTESEHGAMPYYRMLDVENLVRELEKPQLSEQIGNLTAKLKYVIKMYDSANPLEDGVFTFPDGDPWSPEDFE